MRAGAALADTGRPARRPRTCSSRCTRLCTSRGPGLAPSAPVARCVPGVAARSRLPWDNARELLTDRAKYFDLPGGCRSPPSLTLSLPSGSAAEPSPVQAPATVEERPLAGRAFVLWCARGEPLCLPHRALQPMKRKAMSAVNVRCLEGVDPSTLALTYYDGRSR